MNWLEIESPLWHSGAQISQGEGSRLRIALHGVRAVIHRPHPQKETDVIPIAFCCAMFRPWQRAAQDALRPALLLQHFPPRVQRMNCFLCRGELMANLSQLFMVGQCLRIAHLALQLMLIFGLAFQITLVVMATARIGVVMVPLIFLYELGIWLAVAGTRRAEKEAAE